MSAHYRLRSEGPRVEAEEWSRVLEAAWPLYEAFFDGAPKLGEGERLHVSVHEGARTFAEAIRAAGGHAPGPGAGGYYDPGSRTAYLYRQPTRWFTRALLLHEAAHQFHYLANARNKRPGAPWYVEGIADHLSHHTWDGQTLRVGVVPPISLEDYAGQALRATRATGFDLAAQVARDAAPPRPVGMHLVRWMTAGAEERKRFAPLARRMDLGTPTDADDVERAFGRLEALERTWTAWVETVQQPLLYGHVEWDALRADAVRGSASVVATCRSRDPALAGISARFVPPEGRWRAGLTLGWSGVDDYVVFLVRPDGVADVDERRDGRWNRLGPVPDLPRAPDGSWALSARREGRHVTVTVNGRDVGTWPVGRDSLGLAIDAATIDFTDLALR